MHHHHVKYKVEIIVSIELVLRNCKDEIAAEVARTKITNILESATAPKKNARYGEWKAMKELVERKDLVIAPADKGNATVLLDTENYEKALSIIGREPFIKI